MEGVKRAAATRVGLTLAEYQGRLDAGEKWCSGCRCWKVRDAFCLDASRGDGLGSKCYSCRRVDVPRTTKGRISTFKGRHHSEECKRKLSEARKGSKSPMDGRQHSLESRKKMSATKRERDSAVKGPAHHAYKDGKMPERRGLRFTMEYKRWRFDVFARDGFKCQDCGDARGGNLHAHHLKPFADFPELRFEVSNGLTLCRKCHKKRHAKAA